MPRGRQFKAEEIIAKLREAEVELARGQQVLAAWKPIGVTEQTRYRWKKEYGGLRMDQAQRLKELEKENARLKRRLADAELDKAILKAAASGNVEARRNGAGRSSAFEMLSDATGCRSVGPVTSCTHPAARRDGSGASPATNRV